LSEWLPLPLQQASRIGVLDASGWIMPNTGQKEPEPTISPSTGCWLRLSCYEPQNYFLTTYHPSLCINICNYSTCLWRKMDTL
jgi:hypothetical protein